MQTGGVFDELGLGAEELSFELVLMDSNHPKFNWTFVALDILG